MVSLPNIFFLCIYIDRTDHPRCKNLARFSLFFEVLFCSTLLFINVLFSLFYGTCEFHRFLHRG